MSTRHVTTAQRIASAQDPIAAANETPFSDYQRNYWHTTEDLAKLRRQLIMGAELPTASAISPTSILLMTHYVMCLPSTVRVESETVRGVFLSTDPFSGYNWTTKLIGDILGELVEADGLRTTNPEATVFVTGRSERGRWFMVRDHRLGDPWLPKLADMAEFAAKIRSIRRRRGQTVLVYTSKSLTQHLSDIADAALTDADYDYEEAIAESFVRPTNVMTSRMSDRD